MIEKTFNYTNEIQEDEINKEIKDYIESTYDQHYSTTEDGFQVTRYDKTTWY